MPKRKWKPINAKKIGYDVSVRMPALTVSGSRGKNFIRVGKGVPDTCTLHFVFGATDGVA